MDLTNVNAKIAEAKYAALLADLRSLGKVMIGFSGGVDSTFLLYAAKEALGEQVVAVTASSAVEPQRDREDAVNFCAQQGIQHLVLPIDELAVTGFADNPPDRCYICKKTLFTHFQAEADKLGAVLCEGSNMDDLGDYRPGLQALAELKVHSPLRRAELTKAEIRFLSRKLGLPTWNRPASACLASRFVYGEKITAARLAAVDKAEQLLRELGFEQYRVRVHGDLARIEVPPEQIAKAAREQNRTPLYACLLESGFKYVTLDLLGYRTGSMNEALEK